MLWLAAFAWTLALELPVYTLLLDRHLRRWQALCALVLAVNAVTHPLLWFAFPKLTPYAAYVLAGETCVVLVEAALVFAAIRYARRALLASLAANATSTLVGLLLLQLR